MNENHNMKFNKYHINNLDIHHVYTNKFKTVISGIIFRFDLTKKYYAEFLLLTKLLSKTNARFPKEEDFSDYLKDNYNTGVSCNAYKHGKIAEIIFYTTIINPIYIREDNNLYHESINILKDMVLSPNLINGKFSSELLEKEKRLLKETVKTRQNNTRSKAYKILLEEMFKGEFFEIYKGASEDEIDKVTIDSLMEAYKSLLKESAYLFTAGDIKESLVLEAFSVWDQVSTFDRNYQYLDLETKQIEQVNEKIIENKSNQSVLMIGYRVDIRLYERLYPAMIMLNSMLGGEYHSSLIKEVREKRSLAYTISTDYNYMKGFLTISAGINHQNYKEVLSVIDNVINDYVTGNISLDILNMSKEITINYLYLSRDSLMGMLDLLHLTIRCPQRTIDIDKRRKEIESVTLEDIQEAATHLKKDTIVLLKGVQNDEEDE
jgi:predicted Zn-dependent peptidase